jgi:hypothetical protein
MEHHQEHLPTRYGTSDVRGVGFPPRQGAATREPEGLFVQALVPKMAAQTCGPYLYAVNSKGFLPHTAFRTRAHLDQWLENLGLSLEGELVQDSGEYVDIKGHYRTTAHLSYDTFYSLEGKRIRYMDNSDYTLGILVTDADGMVNIHYLNCNLIDRPVFDPAASRALVG